MIICKISYETQENFSHFSYSCDCILREGSYYKLILSNLGCKVETLSLNEELFQNCNNTLKIVSES